jgi:hypothetical protein
MRDGNLAGQPDSGSHYPGAILAGRPGPVLHRGYAAALIEMTTALTPNDKRLYRRILELDRPRGYRAGGCFASVASLARRLAMNPKVVIRGRRKLGALGLLAHDLVTNRWFPTLPDAVPAVPPQGIRGKAFDVWLLPRGAALDAVLFHELDRMDCKRRACKRRGTNSHPERHELSPTGTRIVTEGGTNSHPRIPRFRPLRPLKMVAA